MSMEGVAGLIYWHMRERVITQAQLAEKAGMTASTLSRRLADPQAFTVGELRRIFRALGVPEEERVIR